MLCSQSTDKVRPTYARHKFTSVIRPALSSSKKSSDGTRMQPRPMYIHLLSLSHMERTEEVAEIPRTKNNPHQVAKHRLGHPPRPSKSLFVLSAYTNLTSSFFRVVVVRQPKPEEHLHWQQQIPEVENHKSSLTRHHPENGGDFCKAP
jgi:hypothetical protein